MLSNIKTSLLLLKTLYFSSFIFSLFLLALLRMLPLLVLGKVMIVFYPEGKIVFYNSLVAYWLWLFVYWHYIYPEGAYSLSEFFYHVSLIHDRLVYQSEKLKEK